MNATGLSLTLDLIGIVLEFDIVQLWKFDSGEDTPICQYSFISESGKVICTENTISQGNDLWVQHITKLFARCDKNLGRYIWLSSNEDNVLNAMLVSDELIGGLNAPIKTSFVHETKVIGSGRSYVSCHSLQQMEFCPEKIDYLVAVCDAAYLATSTGHSTQTISEDLDSKDFFFVDTEMDIPQPPLRKLSLTSKEVMEIVEKTNENASVGDSNRVTGVTPVAKDRRRSLPTNSSWSYTNRTLVSPPKPSEVNLSQVFSLSDLPILHDVPDNISFESLTDVKQIGFGQNSALLSAKQNGVKVFVKLMMSEFASSNLVQREFDHEQSLLRRIKHPNIVRILGSGLVSSPKGGSPRRFTLFEWLESGLSDMISTSKGKDKLMRKLIPSLKSIPFLSVLDIAKDLSNALDYLHSGVSPDVSIIHGQIEPENIRISSHGVAKLIGFRSSTCMKRRESNRGYPILEHTGTLRYTPPEVALRLSYSEKSDVYQFGIVLWQVARDKVPFLGFTKAEYLNRVVYGNERPKIDKTWPPQFILLLQNCCHSEQFRRPSFDLIESQISDIMSQISPSNSPPKNQLKRMSWKRSTNQHEENSGIGKSSEASGNGKTFRKAIGESDRKSAWF